jgi:hypothetical protein
LAMRPVPKREFSGIQDDKHTKKPQSCAIVPLLAPHIL